MDLHERISALQKYSGLTIPAFGRKVGFNNTQTLRALLSGVTKTLSYEACTKILSAYPEVNPAWLKSGEGEMLRPAPAAAEGGMSADTAPAADERIRLLQALIAEKDERIRLLTTLVDEKDEYIRLLKGVK